MISSKVLLRLIFALFGSLCCAGVYSASFPERSIRFIVPTTQGGGADTIARNIGVRLSESWAQQVIVDNRPGANGISGVDAAASATPDGHTILMTFTDHFVNPSLYRSLPFDMIKDFAPVIYVGSLPFVLAVNPAVPANSVRELIELARAKPNQLNFGSAGTGGSVHLAGELFKLLARVEITHVPYKGTSAAVPDLISGRIDLMFPSAITVKQFVDAGRVRLLAVTSARRTPDLPPLPTVAESGVPGYEVGIWYGVLAPVRTPPEIIKALNREVGRIVGADDFKTPMIKQGVTISPGTPEEFGTFYRGELKKWADGVKQARIPAVN